MLKTVVLHNIFVETVMHFIFQDSQMNRKFRRTAFIWNCIYCHFLNLMHQYCHQKYEANMEYETDIWVKTIVTIVIFVIHQVIDIE